MHCRLRLPGGRKGRLFPLKSALRHDYRNACPSRRLPAAGRCRSARSATYRIRLRPYDVRSPRAWSLHSRGVLAVPNLGQIEKADYMSDAVVLASGRNVGLDEIAVLAGQWT